MLKAVTRQAAAVDAKISALHAAGQTHITTAAFFDHHATPDDVAVMVTEKDFLDANRELVPSVSAGELEHYERVRASFEGGRGEGKTQPASAAAGRTGPPGKRTVSGQSRGRGKGKGKAVAVGSGGEEEDEVDDEGGTTGGWKGKGKAVFVDGEAGDDEGLYE